MAISNFKGLSLVMAIALGISFVVTQGSVQAHQTGSDHTHLGGSGDKRPGYN